MDDLCKPVALLHPARWPKRHLLPPIIETLMPSESVTYHYVTNSSKLDSLKQPFAIGSVVC